MSLGAPAMSVIWHDLECGAYTADLPVWRKLAAEHGDPGLDVGAGTGRVTLDLARRGHRVTALDQDPVLLSELERRRGEFSVATVCADARSFALGESYASVIVPMQTVQLLGGQPGRESFLRCAVRHLLPGGVLALAITERLEPFGPEDEVAPPVPDMRELGGTVYSSQPTAVRERPDGFDLERVRELVGPAGERSTQPNLIHMDRLTAGELEDEGRAAGLAPLSRTVVPETADHVGSVVVILGG